MLLEPHSKQDKSSRHVIDPSRRDLLCMSLPAPPPWMSQTATPATPPTAAPTPTPAPAPAPLSPPQPEQKESFYYR